MNTRELAQRTQDWLALSDQQMADYLRTNVTTIREVRRGTEPLPIHSKLILLDHAGFLKITAAVMALLPQKAREKVLAAAREQAANVAQANAMKRLKKTLKEEGAVIDDDQEN